jgi:hypothetical protein
MNWKICGMMQPWPNVSYHPGIFQGELKKTIRQLSGDLASGPRSEFGASQIQRWSANHLNLQYQNKGKYEARVTQTSNNS